MKKEAEHVDQARTLKITLDAESWARIDRLVAAHEYCDTVEDFVTELMDHVQQGVYRSGSWERGWLEQAVSDDTIQHTYLAEEDPLNRRRK